MKRVSIAKTPSSVWGLISPPELVTMKVRPWLIVMPGGATLISIGIVFSPWATINVAPPYYAASTKRKIARADTLGKHFVLLCPEGTSLHERHDREVLQLLLQVVVSLLVHSLHSQIVRERMRGCRHIER